MPPPKPPGAPENMPLVVNGPVTLLFKDAASPGAVNFVAWARREGKTVLLTNMTVFDVLVGTTRPPPVVKARFVDALTTDAGVDSARISTSTCEPADPATGFQNVCRFVAGVASRDTSMYWVTNSEDFSVLDLQYSAGLLVVVNGDVERSALPQTPTVVIEVVRERQPATNNESGAAFSWVLLSFLVVFFILSVVLTSCSDPQRVTVRKQPQMEEEPRRFGALARLRTGAKSYGV